MTTIKEDERRNFFRVNDEVYIEFKPISDEEYKAAPETLKNLDDNAFSLSADFATLNNSINPILNNIKQQHPEIGEFLDFINNKIDSLSQHVLYANSNHIEQKSIMANMSASGIQFETSQSFNIQQKMKIKLILLPEKIGILIYGRVIESRENTLSIEFEHLRPEDQELMIKHNLNKQMLEIRENKEND
ncbi:hypothetical protein MNBD_GAMMA07-1395 [hydrothermal vent metagenome]|uniref:PilZ domain-containing protein n=1 Tax=hydrothermal vent metagenome TaxID=652676 RepID=A0A3B0WUP5_9ZZZZ